MSTTVISRTECKKIADEDKARKAKLEADITKTWERDSNVRAEFRNLTIYAAFRRAEVAGKVKICGTKRSNPDGDAKAPSSTAPPLTAASRARMATLALLKGI